MAHPTLPVEVDTGPPESAAAKGSIADESRAAAAGRGGPRLYDLFPRLVGPVKAWIEHLPRVAAMGFDTIYVNSFFATGASRSIYAVADPLRLNVDFANGDDRTTALRQFTAAARRHGLNPIMDLPIATLARDSRLLADHPRWAGRHAGRPADWADVVALNYDDPAARDELLEFWARVIRHYLSLGFGGFVAKSAHLVPADVWQALLASPYGDSDALFIADTVGAPVEASEALAGAGFDYLFNSAKWWDFHAAWALDQQARLRRVAPTIAFPESHDTPRLAAELAAAGDVLLEARLKFHLLFAACFSAGWMLPVGCEFGFARPLDVAKSAPADWEQPRVDLSEFVGAINALRQRCAPLNREGVEKRLTPADHPVVALLRLDGDHLLTADGAALLLFNPDHNPHMVDAGALIAETGGRFAPFVDVTPFRTPIRLEPGDALVLQPFELRVFHADALREPARLADPTAGEKPIRRLAQARLNVQNVAPEVDGGRYPAKRVVGDVLEVTADIFIDGHDKIAACVKYRELSDRDWREVPMAFVENDRWRGAVPLIRNTTYLYTVEAWRDRFESWRADLIKKRDAGQDIALELREGVELIKATVPRCRGTARQFLSAVLSRCETLAEQASELEKQLLGEELHEVMRRHGERTDLVRYPRELSVVVDRLAARFSTWYELFPRSATDQPGRSGTFNDVIRRLPYVRDLGFDVLYFPPIHPIGRTNRKGRNNSLKAGPHDPGSPYAIGSEAGGHTAVHPDLGTLDDFRRLVRAAHEHGLEIALDFAIQCSLDHPWVRQHPEWFDWRPDGSLKYAENPPKKYEDIVNPNFHNGFPDLWYALRDIIEFWVGHGVKIFRVDNPHTKPVPFWEWMIGDIRDRHPEVLFLAEAFTKPKMMRTLAKVGFNQSYTYFTWRNTKRELIEYMTELTQTDMAEYYRPNFFVNTPDINPFILQTGGRPAFMMRAALAATLSSVYGIYSGFELCEAAPLPGREEYLNSEKYEIKPRNWDQPGNIRDYIARLNRIRRDNPALHDFRNLHLYNADDDHILVYGKATAARDNVILAAVNLDPVFGRGSRFEVPLWEFGLPDDASIRVEDLFTGHVFHWHGKHQQVWLDPRVNPAAIWRLGGSA